MSWIAIICGRPTVRQFAWKEWGHELVGDRRLRALCRRSRLEGVEPASTGRSSFAPVHISKAQVEVPKHTADGDMAQAEGQIFKSSDFLLDALHRRPAFQLIGMQCFNRLMRFRPHAFVAPENQRIEHSATQRVPVEHVPMRVAVRRNQSSALMQGVEVFAYDVRTE